MKEFQKRILPNHHIMNNAVPVHIPTFLGFGSEIKLVALFCSLNMA